MKQDVIDRITKILKRGNLQNMDKICHFLSSSWYQVLIEEKMYDVLLENYVKHLGLNWYLSINLLDSWKDKVDKVNKPFNEYKEWNKLISETKKKRLNETIKK